MKRYTKPLVAINSLALLATVSLAFATSVLGSPGPIATASSQAR